MAKHVIIDNGTGQLKMGFHMEDNEQVNTLPSIVMPAMVGSLKAGAAPLAGNEDKEWYVGDDAIKNKSVLDLFYPIANGIVNDMDKMEIVWDHAYNNVLLADKKDHNVLITEAVNTPKQNRLNMAEIFFEKFEVPEICFKVQAEMSIMSTGRQEGCVLDSGDGVTHTCPVINGVVLNSAVRSNHIAGRKMTEVMLDQLNLDGHSATAYSTSTYEWKTIVEQMKRKIAWVSQDYAGDKVKVANSAPEVQKDYELPNKQMIKIAGPAFSTPESLFVPDLFGAGGGEQGHHTLLNESIIASGLNAQEKMYSNIILSGGNTMFEGYPERVAAEMEKLAPKPGLVNLVADKDRYYNVWKGAALVSTLIQFVTAEQYEEDNNCLFPGE